jgi:3-deoxy-D-manno-octulosonate 8-phosphate phosphatase (KDO 8-P phosphatase)
MREAIPGELARRVRLVMLDVDGVLTDGGIFLGETADGRAVEMKRFEITDQLGVKMLQWSGIPVAIVSGRVSPATRLRAEELGVECEQHPGGHKLRAAETLLGRYEVSWEDAAMLGDDLPDVALLRRVGLPVAVANAVAEVQALARWRTRRPGGHGAVREFAEALLRARGEWSPMVEAYLAERDGSDRGAASGRAGISGELVGERLEADGA